MKDNSESNLIYASVHFLKSSERIYDFGLCVLSDISKTIQFLQSNDNVFLDKLKNILTQCRVSKVIITPKDPGFCMKKFKSYLKSSGILYEISDDSEFGCIDVEKGISSLSKVKEPKTWNFLSDWNLSKFAFENLWKKFELDGDCFSNSYIPQKLPLDSFVEIDGASLESLDVFGPDPGAFSLFKVLNKTRTPGGERTLKSWLSRPLTDVNAINRRLETVQTFVNNSEIRLSLHDIHLRKIPDLQSLSSKVSKKKSNLGDLYKIYVGILEAESLVSTIQDDSDLVERFANDLKNYLSKMLGYKSMIKSSIDLEMASKRGEYNVIPSLDEDLQDLYEQLQCLETEIRSIASDAGKDLGLEFDKGLKLEWTNNYGYFYRVTLKDEVAIRKKKKYIVFDTLKSGVKFRTAELSRLNSDHKEIKDQYDAKQSRIIDEINQIASGYSKFIFSIGQIIAELDVLVCFSVSALSAPTPYVKPEILPSASGSLVLKNMRHPVMEIFGRVPCFIPNDAIFDKTAGRFHILTGPNLGGKSTYMRSVAINVIMAQIGSFVSCSEAQVSITDKILVRIGAGDSQLEGISTFMSEMLEAAHILRSATNNSLILIDEIGRGTSTYDGLGLAWAIAEKIASSIDSFTVFATHFFELTILSSHHENVQNYHVTADVDGEKFTLLYKVQQGKGDRSYGIEVAEIAKFPPEVVKNARIRLQNYERTYLLDDKIDTEKESMESWLKQASESNYSPYVLKNIASEMRQKEKWNDMLKKWNII